MTNGVIVTSHASLASGVYSTVQMIAGDFENVRVLEFKNGDKLDDFDSNLKNLYDDLKDYKNVIVLADLAGGTPFNRSVLNLSQYDNVRIIGGINFASLFQAINSDCKNIDDCVSEIIQTAKDSIIQYKLDPVDNEEDDFEL